MTCIKCGKEIPDGELFCPSCSLNLPSAYSDTAEAPRVPAPAGRMQKPVPVKRTAPQMQGPQVQAPRRTGMRIALAIVSILLAASLGFLAWQYGNIFVERNRLRTRENAIVAQEKQIEELEQQIKTLTTELTETEQMLAARNETIKDLQAQLSGSQSSQTQSEFDLSNAQAQLDQLTEENRQLLTMAEDLEAEIAALEESKASLETALDHAKSYEEKANFMDSYVVFVEDDGTGYYHTYSCINFTRNKFWAYSRKLAEANGYDPCPICGGRP